LDVQHAKHRQPISRLASTRERIDRAAYELFSRHGVRGVGVDTVCARSGVAKMTLYKHYPSKDKLALAFLRRREELWTWGWLQGEVEQRARTPGEQLLAIFDVFDKWFRRPDFEGCPIIRVMLEHDPGHPVRNAAAGHIATVRTFLRQLAGNAGVSDADGLAHQWQILMKGSIVSACEGDRDAARRAKELGLLLLAREGITPKKAARSSRSRLAPMRENQK
jgi:AcrR family transcriptional regulator